MELKAPYSEESRGDITSSPLTDERLRMLKSSGASLSEHETAFIFRKITSHTHYCFFENFLNLLSRICISRFSDIFSLSTEKSQKYAAPFQLHRRKSGSRNLLLYSSISDIKFVQNLKSTSTNWRNFRPRIRAKKCLWIVVWIVLPALRKLRFRSWSKI